MKRIAAFLCVVALLLGVINPAVFASDTAAAATNGTESYSNLQAAVDAYTSGVIVLEANAQDITVNRDTYLDLNGHDVGNVTVTGGTLYCMDSETDDYTVADGVYGELTGTVSGNVAPVPQGANAACHGYLMVKQETGTSFHCVNLQIYAMSLRASDVGVYYKSHFAGDELVAERVQAFGVALSVVAAPTAANLEKYCGVSAFTGFRAGEGSNSGSSTGTLLRNIMKTSNTDMINARNSAVPVYGRAYIKTADGYLFGATVKRSLQQQVEAVDAKWTSLMDTQRAPVSAMYETYAGVMDSWNIPNIQAGEPGTGSDEIVLPIQVTAENGVVTEEVTVSQNGVTVTVPAGTVLEEGAESLTAIITRKDTSDAGLTLEEAEVLVPMDVHVDGISAENTAPLTVYLGKVMPENLNMGNYTVYHVENGMANEMTLIPVNEEFTGHNQYKYTLDGEVILHMATFSETAVVYNTDNAWNGDRDYSWYTNAVAPAAEGEAVDYEIRNADQLAAFGAIVGGMAKDIAQDSFSGKTVTLLSDIDLGDNEENNDSEKIFYPIGYWNNTGSYEKVSGKVTVDGEEVAVSSGYMPFAGTFDGNGNTISEFYQNTWEMFGDYNDGYSGTPNHSRDGMGLFGKVYGGTVKNLTVENFSSDGEFATTGVIAAYADCGATFENIAITNCNPRVYNIGNGGIVGCVGWYTKDATEDKVSFKNITVDQTNKISALWGSYDVSCGGLVGQYYPTSGQGTDADPIVNAGISFENCHVAAIMDVNNDVCANYQYYWYRYSGMLIGTIRANTTDDNGYTVADTTGITVTGCTYTLGDWNEYWYCELVKNSLASYTHDHQFSRLTKIANISEISDDEGQTWKKEGNFVIPAADNSSATCYHIFKNSEGNLYQHFHDVLDESNPEIYETFDLNGDGELNDLKEDRTCYFMPFNQIFNGLGYGVQPTYEFEGITQVTGAVKAEPKFEESDDVKTYRPGQTITLGQLVNAIVDDSKLSKPSIYAAVSPATEADDVSATYSLDLSDWKNSKLTFAKGSTGSAKIIITDYFYCTPTVIILDPEPAVEKFTTNNVDAQSAYTQITLGDLFGVKDGATIGNVTATVTDPNGTETTVTGTSEDWASKTIDLTSDGEWTVVIKDDDAYCAVTTVTFTVNKVDKFARLFDKNFLYRVGNLNTVTIGTIFAEKETAVKLTSVNVTIENVKGDATGTFTSNATWTSGTMQFTGTGVVNVTISADGANAVEQYLEIVTATNLTSAKGTTSGGDFVLMSDVNTSTYVNYWNSTLYGNGFTYSLNGAPTTYNGSHGHGVLITQNATLDNLVIIGDIYDEYGAYTSNNDYNAAIDVKGETIIQNCYIANCAAPVRTRANTTIIDTTLYGGTVANLIINSGIVTLENVTTANFDDGRANVGLGIVAGPDATDAAKLILTGTLTQYNYLSEANEPTATQAKTVHQEMFSQCDGYYFGTEPNRYINTGICSMSEKFTVDDIEDNANTGYQPTDVTLNNTNGFLYSQKYSDSIQVNNGYDEDGDPNVATTQGAVAPAYEFDYTEKNYQAKQDGINDYCYEENGTVYISMDAGDTVNWDTSILTATKNGATLDYTVSMNGTDYTQKSIAFNTVGDYIVTYTYTDDNNYTLDENDSISTYSKTYVKSVHINVTVVKAAWKNAEIKVNNTAMSGIYIMSGDYDYSYKMKFLDCVTITDYTEAGEATAVDLSSEIQDTSFVSYDSSGKEVNPGEFDDNNGLITITYSNNKILKVSIGDWNGSGPSTKTCTVKTDDGIYLITDGASNAANTGVTWKITGYSYTGNNGAEVKNNTEVTFTWNTNSEGYNSKDSGGCFTPDTLITLADGTQKRIDELSFEDKILAWDFFTGSYVEQDISILVNHGENLYKVANLKFSDDTLLRLIDEHGVFDYDLNQYVYITVDNMNDYIGHRFVQYNADGSYNIVTLTSAYETEEHTSAWSISSAITSNAFASGLLTVAPPDDFYNWIEMDGKLHYDVEQFEKDVETYGLYTYDVFAEYVTYEQYVAFNGAYLKIPVEKGLFTFEYILELIDLYVGWMPQ